MGGCCAPSAVKTKGNAASGRISTRFSRHCRTCVHANYLRHDSSINACWEMGCCLHRFLISGPDLRIDARISSFTPSFVHRFLISGPNLRIDVSFSPFTPSFVHRFLISGPNLGIDARFSRFTATRVHRFLISGGQFGNHCRFFPVYAFLRAVILDLRG